MLHCCEHNPCPYVYGPKWFLRRFTDKPWRCPHCGKLWHTVPSYSWGETDGFEWKLSLDPVAIEKYVKGHNAGPTSTHSHDHPTGGITGYPVP